MAIRTCDEKKATLEKIGKCHQHHTQLQTLTLDND